jgi:drug/metabolite transporter (DMT)-like permease
MLKGMAAGTVNLLLATVAGAAWPSAPELAGALVVGGLSYGVSLSLFVVGLRHLGTARTGAYFSVAPFFGALLAIPLLGEHLTVRLSVTGLLMGDRRLAALERAARPRACPRRGIEPEPAPSTAMGKR